MNRFQFVADHQHAYTVKRLCQAVEIARSSFYAWQEAGPARAVRAAADAELAQRIRTVQDPKAGGDPAYGAPRVTVELNDGVPVADRVNHKRVARVMRAHGLAHRPRSPRQTILISRELSTGRPQSMRALVASISPQPWLQFAYHVAGQSSPSGRWQWPQRLQLLTASVHSSPPAFAVQRPLGA